MIFFVTKQSYILKMFNSTSLKIKKNDKKKLLLLLLLYKNGAIYDDIYDGNYVRHDKKPNNKDLIKTYYY